MSTPYLSTSPAEPLPTSIGLPSICASFQELKKMAGEYFRALPSFNLDEMDNAHKCLSLAYLGLDSACENEQYQASVVIMLASKLFLKREALLLSEQDALATVY